MHRLFPQRGWLFAVEQMQEVAADGIIVGFGFDPLAVLSIVIPVQQHRAERCHKAIRDVARARRIVVVFLRQYATECGYAGTHHVHRMRRSGQAFQRHLDVGGQTAQCLQLGFVGFQFRHGRQLAMHQQVRNFFEFARVGDIENVIAAIMQIVAGLADCTQCRITGGHAGQCYGFLGFEACGWLFAHDALLKNFFGIFNSLFARQKAHQASARSRGN